MTATTYEPSSNIPRWQMALYLTRTMDVVGQTLGTGADQSFTDIGGYSAAIQTAINQLAQSGVTLGTTATTYSPDDNVTREQMAIFLNRMADLLKDSDTDNNGLVQLTDAIFLLNYLFLGGGAPPAPTNRCGFDPEEPPDGIGCERFTSCP